MQEVTLPSEELLHIASSPGQAVLFLENTQCLDLRFKQLLENVQEQEVTTQCTCNFGEVFVNWFTDKLVY